jgi:uncharacterized protein YdeI (YjbR/CyaY-like superfamily)
MALEPHDLEFFATPAELRAWLVEHHATATELWIGRYKKATGRPSVTWQEIVDQVLCFGWIDGQGKRIDDEVFAQRITPRTARSIWSTANIAKVAALAEAGLMEPAGLAAFEARREDRSGIYSHEQAVPAVLSPEQEAALKARPGSWEFWERSAPSYRRAATHWVQRAKKEETRARRLAILVDDSARGQRVPPLRR